MQTKRYEAFGGYGSYSQAHVFDNVKMWIVEFSPSLEAAEAKANELNSAEEKQVERRSEESAILQNTTKPAERVGHFRI